MKKKAVIIVLIIALALIVGVGLFFYLSGSQAQRITTGQKVTVGEYSFVINKVEFVDSAEIRGKKWGAGNAEDFCVVHITEYNESRKVHRGNKVTISWNCDDGYDTGGFVPEWEYGTSTYVRPEMEPGYSYEYRNFSDVPDALAKDTSASFVLKIHFEGKDFQLKVR